ncbi:hypothetical protein FRB99_002567 [Tulasnella sp. 403]|nr:hypothetical protein FRB99_002567 [Tulasnella sp. 403]
MSSDPSRFDPRYGQHGPPVPQQNAYPYSYTAPHHPQSQPQAHYLDPADDRYAPPPAEPHMEVAGPVVHSGYGSQYPPAHQVPTEPPPVVTYPSHHPPPTYANEPPVPQAEFQHIIRAFNTLSTVGEHLQDTGEGPSARGKQVASMPPAVFNSMVQNAVDGLRLLDPASAEKYIAGLSGIKVPEVSEEDKPSAPRGPAGPDGGPPGDDDEGAGDTRRRRRDERLMEPQQCLTCHAKSSPEWRRGPLGPRTLCNACGLVYIKIMKRRAKGLPEEEEEGGGDDDDAHESGYDSETR